MVGYNTSIERMKDDQELEEYRELKKNTIIVVKEPKEL